MSDWIKLAIVLLGTIVAAIIGIALAQNLPCKRCKRPGYDCECGR